MPPFDKIQYLPASLLQWLKDNPLKSIAGSAIALIGVPMINAYYQSVFLPGLTPLNVVTEVSASNPSKKRIYTARNGVTYSPLELNVTIHNPGKRKLHLLKTYWVGEVCSILEHYANTPQQESHAFDERIERNNQPFSSTGNGQLYLGYDRACKFVGMGRLVRDSSISPDESLNAKLVIVYPTTFPTSANNKEERNVDFIRITTFVPSMTSAADDLRAQVFLRDTGKFRYPDGIIIYEKRAMGLASECAIERLSSAPNNIAEPEPTTYVTDSEQQVWCPLSDQKRDINITRSVNETWLKDRINTAS